MLVTLAQHKIHDNDVKEKLLRLRNQHHAVASERAHHPEEMDSDQLATYSAK